MSQRGYRDDDTDTPFEWWVTAYDARRKAWRAFAYGAVIFGALGAAAGAVFGGDTAEWGGTGCQLVPVSGQTHVAEVHCRNVETSGASMTEGDMVAGDLAAHVAILHGPGDIPDRFTITPQPGYIADPQTLTLDEWAKGVVLIYPFVGA